ncbi:MAG: hypothetical protein R3E79_51465 [Caldilineaceae bacterium]
MADTGFNPWGVAFFHDRIGSSVCAVRRKGWRCDGCGNRSSDHSFTCASGRPPATGGRACLSPIDEVVAATRQSTLPPLLDELPTAFQPSLPLS